MDRLIDGHIRFKREVFPRRQDIFARLANRQNPMAMLITCSDSRVVPELITQADPGDIFVYRNAGNIVPPYGSGSEGAAAAIEFAVVALGVRDIIVCGHTDCGAMKGCLQHGALDAMPTVRAWLRHADVARHVLQERRCDDGQALDLLIRENVLAQLQHLRTHPVVAAKLATGQIGLHGWVFDIRSGTIAVVDENGLAPLEDAPDPLGRAAPAAVAALR